MLGDSMQLNKGDIIKDGEKYFSVFCIIGSVVYVNGLDVNSSPGYELVRYWSIIEKLKLLTTKY